MGLFSVFQIKKEIDKSTHAVANGFSVMKNGEAYLTSLPKKGLSESGVLKRIKTGYQSMGK